MFASLRIDVALSTKPISKPSYSLSASELAEVEHQLVEYLNKGFTCKSFYHGPHPNF